MVSNSDICQEIYEILSFMDKQIVKKIPQDILKSINELRNRNYKTRIDKNNLFNEENVYKQTIDFFCWIEYNYWMDEQQKKNVDRIIQEKNNRENEEKLRLYNPDDLFKKG